MRGEQGLKLFEVIMDILAEKGPISIYGMAKEASKRLNEDKHKIRMRIMRLIEKLEKLGMVEISRGPRNAKLVNLAPKGLNHEVKVMQEFITSFKSYFKSPINAWFYYKRTIIKKLVKEGKLPKIISKMSKLSTEIVNAIKKSLDKSHAENIEEPINYTAYDIIDDIIAEWVREIESVDGIDFYRVTLNSKTLKRYLITIFNNANLSKEDIEFLKRAVKGEQLYHEFFAEVFSVIHEVLKELKRGTRG